MSVGHTPGPWVAGYGDGLTGPTTASTGGPCCGGKKWPHFPVSHGESTIAIVPAQETSRFSHLPDERAMAANARLIAAAPGLLEAMESIVRITDLREDNKRRPEGLFELLRDAAGTARAAVAKATGKEAA